MKFDVKYHKGMMLKKVLLPLFFLLSLYSSLIISGRIGRDPDGQRVGLPHRDAQDPHRKVRRHVRRGVRRQQVHAVPPGQLRQEDRPEPQHAEGAAELDDQLD